MKGKISIGKVTCYGSSEEDYISIGVEDELSSISFLAVKMGLENFTKALMGLANVPVDFELRGIDRVGKRYEHKTEQVHIPHDVDGNHSDIFIDRAIANWEIDGWIGRREDCKNHHNWVENRDNGSIFNVHFCRWVDIEKE